MADATAGRVLAALVCCLGGAVIAISASPRTTQGTTASRETAVVSGVVVDGATGTPVEDAIVLLALSGPNGRPMTGTERQQLTDERGRFAFTKLPASPIYRLTVTKTGYLEGAFARNGVPSGPLTMLVVDEGAWVSNVKVTMWRPGAISGTILDERGEPVIGIYVRALAKLRIQGRDALAAGPFTTTDDRGVYRIAGLAPGRYLVHVPSPQAAQPSTRPSAVTPPVRPTDPPASLAMDATTRLILGRFPLPPPPENGRARAYPMAFHPAGRTMTNALEVELRFGEERHGVDVVIEPVTVWRVSGHVQAPAEGFANLTVRLLPPGLESLSNSTEIATARVAADGSFTFVNVPAGSYVLDAPFATSEFVTTTQGTSNPNLVTPPGSSGATMLAAVDTGPPGTWISTKGFSSEFGNYIGRTTVSVEAADVSGVVLTLRPAGTMSGRVIVETDPSLNTGRLMSPATSMLLEPANANPDLGIVQPDYRPEIPEQFLFRGLGAGEYVMRGGGSVWMIKSVMWNGRDYTTAPFDASATQAFTNVVVTFTNRVPGLAGTVKSAAGAPSAGAAVLVFRADRSRWTNFGFRPPDMKATVTGNTGAYQLDGLPAGDYFAIAVDAARRLDWLDAKFLAAAAPLATPVTLGWGGRKTVELTVQEVR